MAMKTTTPGALQCPLALRWASVLSIAAVLPGAVQGKVGVLSQHREMKTT